jgi:hypothetical protein
MGHFVFCVSLKALVSVPLCVSLTWGVAAATALQAWDAVQWA